MRRRERGFTYLGVLLVIALLGIGLSAASEVWSTTAQRQRMTQLAWVGEQYVQAIGSYYESSPDGVKRYPNSIEDLLEDRRVPFVRRHLRQQYANPLTGMVDWELVAAQDGGFSGVRMNANGTVPDRAAREFVYSPQQ